MDKFAFIIHPLSINDIYGYNRLLSVLPQGISRQALKIVPPFMIPNAIKAVLPDKRQIEGMFVVCPLLPDQYKSLPEDFSTNKIIRACKIAENQGASIIGLGGYTSVVGDKGITISRSTGIPVTTGNSYTVAIVVNACIQKAKEKEVDLLKAKAAIIGATGSIGCACTKLLAESMFDFVICAPDKEKLLKLKDEILEINSSANVIIETEPKKAVQFADIVISTSSAPKTLFNVTYLKENAIACDVSVPPNISLINKASRPDVSYFKGGLVNIPSHVKLRLDVKLPANVIYACMAETIILTIAQQYENYSLGKDLSLIKVKEIIDLGKTHGFTAFHNSSNKLH